MLKKGKDPDPDPQGLDTKLRIQIRIRSKMFRIQNTAFYYSWKNSKSLYLFIIYTVMFLVEVKKAKNHFFKEIRLSPLGQFF
jgi:hypothetical protein